MKHLIRYSLLATLAATMATARPDLTVLVNPAETRGTWEGWGTSLCWWGNGVGRSSYEGLYADLLFTEKTVTVMGKPLPGLGLNLLRYNVGGGGRPGDVGGRTESVPDILPWHRNIEGYWIRGTSADPATECWDWSRDANQRSMMGEARDRGVRFEFFSNAPMWWMTAENSSAGGRLQPWNRRDFAVYLATVVQHAKQKWGVHVESLEPFNEPIAGWWNYPKNQEGCNFDRETQAEILGHLRHELDTRGLKDVKIAASDENTMVQAKETHEFFKEKGVDRLVDRVNVHGYRGLSPWRDNAARTALRATAGSKSLWMSEFGDPDGGGMPMAQSIVEDVNFLRPSAWIYWQAIEAASGWGLLNADFGKPESRFSRDRGRPTWVYTKYYVFAQFTRFLRPGMRILGSDDSQSIVGFDPRKKRLSLVTVNRTTPQRVTYDLSRFRSLGREATLTVTNAKGPKSFSSSKLRLDGKKLTFDAEPDSVYSVSIDGVRL
jgi:galactan endo-1,6-beta-galactosidase